MLEPGVYFIRVQANGSSGKSVFSPGRQFTILAGKTTGESGNNLPLDFELQQNFPNPFNPSTAIEFSLAQTALVRLLVYNSLGQPVRRLLASIGAS